jgi:hypothetical protein
VAEEYSFEVAAKLDKAIASVDLFASKTQKQLDSINFNTGVTAIKEGFDAVYGFGKRAFEAISGFADKAVDAAKAADIANVELANALRVTGDYSAKAVEKFDRLADAISSSTIYSDKAVKSSIALAKQYSLTNDEAAKVVRVATDLAAIQGTSLDEATRRVSQTFNGFVDRGLNKVIPGIKKLSQESLIAGGAIGLIQAKINGSAQALGNTYAGAVTKASNASERILETLGDFIVKNPAVIAGINVIADGFRDFNTQIINNGGQIRGLVTDGFILFIQSVPEILKATQSLSKGFIGAGAGLSNLGIIFSHSADLLKSTDLENTKKIIADISDQIDKVNTAAGSAANSVDDAFVPMEKSAQSLADKVTEAARAAKHLNETVGDSKSTSGFDERRAILYKKSIEEIAKEPIAFAFTAVVKAQAVTNQEKVAIGAGVLAAVVKGADGARKAVSSAIGAAANAIIPGIGGAVGEIVDVLSQGPEKTKEMVTEFVDAIPDMIQNLADSLPVLIETLAEKLPPALAKAMPIVAIAFSTALVTHIPDIIAGFVRGLIQGAKDFVNELIKQIKNAITPGGDGHKIGQANGGSLVGRGVADVLTLGVNEITGNAIGNFLDSISPFADGGRIPNDARFEGDKYPARLNAGEQVLGKDLSSKLEAALSNGGLGGGGTMIVKMMLGEQQLAQAILKLNRGDFRLA